MFQDARIGPRLAAVAAVAGCVVGAAAFAAASDRAGALVLAGGLGAIGAVTLVLMLFPGRLGDLLLLAAIGSMTVPLDTYFMSIDHVGGWPGIRLSASDLALIASLPVALLGVWVRRTRNVVPRSVLVLYTLVLAQYVISLANATRQDAAVFELLSAIHSLFTAFIVGALFRRELLRPVLALLAIQVVVHTGFAAAQVASGRPIGADVFQGARVVSEVLETGDVRLRPSGLFDHPIIYANMLLLTLPMLFAGLFVPGGRIWRAGLTAALVIGAAGLALTLSRGAWISTACAGALLMIIAARQHLLVRRQWVRLAVGIAAIALLIGPPFAKRIYDRLTASEASNLSVRFELNWIAVSMIQSHPLAGVGISNFIPVMDQYDPTNVMRRFPATVHNLYLLEGAEAGIPGMVLMMALFATVLTAGWRRIPLMDETGAVWVAAAILAGLCGFLVSQLADFSHRLEPLRSVIWMNVGLLFALQRTARARVPTVEDNRVPTLENKW